MYGDSYRKTHNGGETKTALCNIHITYFSGEIINFFEQALVNFG